jgi:hypothetical protein
MMFLLQTRMIKHFEGEKFNDEEFKFYFLKIYDMLLTQEQIIQSPISFA